MIKIKKIFVFDNNQRCFTIKGYNRKRQVGYPVAVWTLYSDEDYYWSTPSLMNVEALYNLNSEKKKRWASFLSRKYDCKIIYVKGERAKRLRESMFSINLPFRKGDL